MAFEKPLLSPYEVNMTKFKNKLWCDLLKCDGIVLVAGVPKYVV